MFLFAKVVYDISSLRRTGTNEMNNETWQFETGDKVTVIKDVQFRDNNEVSTVLQGETGTVKELGRVPTIYGYCVDIVVVTIDGITRWFLPSDLAIKL